MKPIYLQAYHSGSILYDVPDTKSSTLHPLLNFLGYAKLKGSFNIAIFSI